MHQKQGKLRRQLALLVAVIPTHALNLSHDHGMMLFAACVTAICVPLLWHCPVLLLLISNFGFVCGNEKFAAAKVYRNCLDFLPEL
jgi:hypothetical protein